MKFWIAFLLLEPLFAVVGVLLYARRSERLTGLVASFTKYSIALATLVVLAQVAASGFSAQEVSFGDLLHLPHYEFPLLFYIDGYAAVFLALTSFIFAVIIRFCRYYLHREAGYTRFFVTIFFFLLGMNLLVTAGTIDLLFAGWELVGISSFLLIGFYRTRSIPVQNALRAYYVYRFCDIGLLLGAWVGHLIWSGPLRFSWLSSASSDLIAAQSLNGSLALSLLVLLAATGKSAQFPFCFWLPRAMEGPTPSSAIFYGALSIHAGVFLLIRLFALWDGIVLARCAMGAVGVLSVIVATVSRRTQSNIKGQLAYASITQVGLIFLELALGFKKVAVAHAIANTCIRCYQILISSSVVADMLRAHRLETFKTIPFSRLFPQRISFRWKSSLYVLSLNEFYLQALISRFIVTPLITVANHKLSAVSLVLLCLGGILAGVALGGITPATAWLGLMVFVMVFSSLKAVGERASAFRAWIFVGISCGMAGLLPERIADEGYPAWIYFSGTVLGWTMGLGILWYFKRRYHRPLSLARFQGLAEESPSATGVLLLCSLALAAFPISPTFIGEDLLLQSCGEAFVWIGISMVAVFVINGAVLLRLYSYISLGPPPQRL